MLLSFAFAASAFPQSSNATLGGTVADSTGALIPGVSVIATNTATGIVTMSITNETGAYQVTAHLADGHGYTSICFIAGPPDSPDSARRLDGFRRATAGLPETPVYHGDFTTAGGRRVAERIIAAGRVPRALVCANDQTAIGVMTALQHAGLSVPGDVAVTGFDGIWLGRHLRPSLTTVVQPMAALGDTAVAMLTDRIGGVGPSSTTLPPQILPRRTVELPVRLELRGSCGCAP